MRPSPLQHLAENLVTASSRHRSGRQPKTFVFLFFAIPILETMRGLPPPRAPRPQRPAERLNTKIVCVTTHCLCCKTKHHFLCYHTNIVCVGTQKNNSLCYNTNIVCVATQQIIRCIFVLQDRESLCCNTENLCLTTQRIAVL